MKKLTLRACALLVAMAALAGCSAHCNCPVCPHDQPPQTTIIHEPDRY